MSSFFLKVSDVIGEKEHSFIFIAIGSCAVMKVLLLFLCSLVDTILNRVDYVAAHISFYSFLSS